MKKRRIHLTENQLHGLIGQTINEIMRRLGNRKIKESVDSDDALYQHIADCVKKDLQEELLEYEDGYRERTDSKTGEKYIITYDKNLYDKIEVPTYIKYKPDANTFIFGTIYSWFEHEYDFLIGCGVDTSMLVICHVDDNMRAVDEPKPFPIDLKRLNQLIGAFDSETEQNDKDIDIEPF